MFLGMFLGRPWAPYCMNKVNLRKTQTYNSNVIFSTFLDVKHSLIIKTNYSKSAQKSYNNQSTLILEKFPKLFDSMKV